MRPAWLEIDLDAFAHNVAETKRLIGPQRKLIAVVKADGYGHGAAPVARQALGAGADMLAVALIQEALALREAGVSAPILVLGSPAPEEAEAFIEGNVIAPLQEMEFVRALGDAARRIGRRVAGHVKIDSGMGRLGVRADEVRRFAGILREQAHIRVEGAFSHFAAAPEDPEFTHSQTRAFLAAAEELAACLGHAIALRHLANSGATVCHTETWLDAVRPGALLYGIYCEEGANRVATRQVMSLKARVAALRRVRAGESVGYGRAFVAPRDTLAAVLPVGYADGYPRALSNAADVLIGGRRCPVMGRVSMDSVVVDVGAVPQVGVGEEAVLLGCQGREMITTGELAQRAGTIVQEIASRMGARLPRVYLGGEVGGHGG